MTLTLTHILTECARAFNEPAGRILGSSRAEIYVHPRFAYYHLATRHTYETLVEIAEFCGGRDHGVVIHGVKRVKDWLASDDRSYLAFQTRYALADRRLTEIMREFPAEHLPSPATP